MNKTIIISSLLLFSVLLTGCNSQADYKNTESRENTLSYQNTKEVAEVDKVEIIDFHGSRRCFSCQTIEKFAKETVEEFFQAELRDGKITFDSINVEKAENKDIVQKYQARGSSLFVNVIRDGEDDISEDTQVWRLVRDEQAYKKYFKEKIENLLK